MAFSAIAAIVPEVVVVVLVELVSVAFEESCRAETSVAVAGESD